jgi:hypothetical protein
MAALLVAGAACSSSGPSATSSTTSSSSTSTTKDAGLFGALPSGCDGTAVSPAATPLTFAAGGRVWAVDPTGADHAPHCLFAAKQPGLFSWGPKGDRLLLSGMEVHGVGGGLSRPKGTVTVSYYSWSRPTGTTVVWIDPAQTKLSRADMSTADTRDITPLPNVRYGDLAYHPSGLSIGFVGKTQFETEIWMATNQGGDPVALVQAPPTTAFNHLVFAHDGVGLFYSIDRGTQHTLARYDLTTGKSQESLWSGDVTIADIVEAAGLPGVGLTVGASCTDHRAVYSALDGGAGTPLGESLGGPTSVVGRVDGDRFVLAVGGCNGAPADLYLVSRSGTQQTLLARGVDAAAWRAPEPTPPPPLPPRLPAAGFA